ncbi:MAG: histidine phosphatase family protein [Bradyrhizobium sp.]|nr:MAG: histidine phosphatase family protein [Bradyrhizobium sp.]
MPSFSHRILFVRHGETSYNSENRLQGQRDIGLNPLGRQQAREVGEKLRKLVPEELARLDATGEFHASPLRRTRETMELARAAMGLAPSRYRLDPLLIELTFGAWEGLTWPEVGARDPVGAAAREADKWNFCPPGGESYAMLAERLLPWLEARRADCFVVSHGGVARALMTLIAGVAPLEAENAEIWQGRAIVFENGAFRWIG